MKRQSAKEAAAQPDAPWKPDGAEASAVLELARSVDPLPGLGSEEVSAEWFTASFRLHRDRKRKSSMRMASPAWRYGLAFAAAVALVGSAAKLSGFLGADSALSYHEKSGAAVGRLIEARQEPVELDFSDGTVVTLERKGQALVSETTERGARFRLDSGRMRFNVVPNPGRGRWLVDAGPFQVRVTGTIFTVEWLAGTGSLHVEVERGHVIVEGAGQRRELGPGDSFNHTESSAEAAESAKQDAAETSTKSADIPVSPLPPAVSARDAERATPWSALVAAGDYSQVLEAANQRGLQSCLDSCNRDDLRALADAARLGGNSGVADRALRAQRARFAGSSDAAAAAFLLGRSAEDRREPKAIEWYDLYLREAPHGRFASDALGRKMVLLEKSNPQQALELAKQYTAQFASGSYAGHARSLIEAAGGR
ncbi:MAG TPA: FecR family protein [Polyangiaceae bacterium]|nr:FecR family protein [Polyangiaceae bacterium]